MVAILSKYRFNYSFLFWFVLLTIALFVFSIPNSSGSTQVTLEWSPNSEPDLAGYALFCREQGQNYNYDSPCWEGTDTTCTIYDLDETKSYFFVVRAVDTEGFQSSDSNEAFLEAGTTPDNQPPIADAGPNQTVNEGQLVGLDGANSLDSDDGIASYGWVQTSGPQVTLSDPNAKQSTFTAPDVDAGGDSLTFELTVTDHNGLQSVDSCVVNVTWLNEPPQANAGLDQTVDGGSVVTLDATDSLDIDDSIVSYSWKQTNGQTVTLLNAASDQATFTAPNVESDGVSLTFELTVTDTGTLSDTDSCIVNITQIIQQNQTPTAVVAPDYTETTGGTLVTMDGSGSTDPDGEPLSYVWSQEEGEPVSLSDPTSAVTTFTAPKSEPFGKNIKLKLTVKDHGGLQSSADASVYVMESEVSNAPPIADFSYDDKKKLIMFTDGSKDSDGTIVSWFWEFGDGNTSTEQHPSNRYVKAGNYTVKLTVTDNGGESHSITRDIAVTKSF
jgi:PKD repeat protein